MRCARACALVAAIAGLGGCGSGGRAGDKIPGTTLTIYASAPMHGASSSDARAVVAGEELALSAAGARIGNYRIALKVLDDSTVARQEWDPVQTTQNAHTAAQDRTTIGYLGEFNSGASAVAIPILNRAGIAQVSATSTAVGLTSGQPGASPGEPEKYYPTGTRTFARVIPNDAVQAAAQVKLQRTVGCTKTFVLEDGEFDGQDMATSFAVAANSAGLPVGGVDSFDPRGTDYSSLAAGLIGTGTNCVLISALTESDAALLAKQLAAALPKALIFGTAGLAESNFTDPGEQGIPLTLDSRVLITAATLAPAAYPPAGRVFFSSYVHRYGLPQPYAIYGYESMSLLLDAIRRATAGGTQPARRSKVVAAIFATRNRKSVLGTYSIDRNGDTTLGRYGVYRVVRGRLEFWQAIVA